MATLMMMIMISVGLQGTTNSIGNIATAFYVMKLMLGIITSIVTMATLMMTIMI